MPGRWISLFVIVLALMGGCRHAPGDEKVRKALAAAVQGAEAGSAGDTVQALTDDFDGNGGQLDKRALANMVRALSLRGQKAHALMGPVTVDRLGERIVATFTVTLTAGTGVLPDDAGVYKVETGWRKDGDDWRCFSATWKRAL